MGRPLRPVADGLVYHALNRGNNRGPAFTADGDFQAFPRALAQTPGRYPFQLYGYCLLTNHFHLLLAPAPGQSISRIVQSLTVAHTWRYHRPRGTVGHVWQGRFRSPVIQCDEHALSVLRSVEGNPLRAGIVQDLGDCPGSSYAAHGRQARWRTWVHTPLTVRELPAVRRPVTRGRPFGAAAWVGGMATAWGLASAPRPPGRPRKAPRPEK
jgi:putative transposase